MDSTLLDSPTPPPRPDPTNPIRVWLLLSKYGGDNAQVRGLGDHLTRRLGWACAEKQVRFHAERTVVLEELPAAIRFSLSDSLDPPYPDVVISCSRFYGVVGAWLKRRAAETGRRIVHIHLGRIAAPMPSFDLIAATAQYGLPAAPNFVPLALPFVVHNSAHTESAVAAWEPRLGHLPRPWTVLLVGGPTSLIPFGAEAADQIADQAIKRARASGGSLLLAVSRRTPGPIRHRIAARIAAATDLPSWAVGWPAPDPNPYPALLALGDRFVVSCDSASMIADAMISGKPVDLVRLPFSDYVERFSTRGLGLSIDTRRRRRGREGRRPDLLDRLRDFLVARHWMRPWDEMRDFLHGLESHGLLDPQAGDRAQRIQNEELEALTARAAELLAAARVPTDAAVDPSTVTAQAA